MKLKFTQAAVFAAKMLPWIISAALITYIIPWCYHFITDRSEPKRFIMYSGIIKDFAILDNSGDKPDYTDTQGHHYTEAEFDSILTPFYYRQLIAEERLPDTLHGTPVSAKLFQTENFTFRSSPSEINKPSVQLYFLLESMSGRVDLSMPDDVFRINDKGIEFVEMNSNCVNEKKSRTFTNAMLKKGFKFPAKVIAGNGTNRKDYDNGYLITDAQGILYNLKMQRGRPYFRKIETPDGLDIHYMFVTEFRNQRWLGFIIDKEGYFYVLENRSYSIIKCALPPVNPKNTNIAIIGNPFDWTVTCKNSDGTQRYAINAKDYTLLRTLNN